MSVGWFRWVATVAADGAALTALRPDLRLLSDVTAPHGWIARTGVDGAAVELAGAALWVTACWLAVGLVAAALAAMPGRCGRAGARFAATVLPQAVYRVVVGAAGLGIALTPVAAGAAAPPSTPAETTSPAWPTSTAPAPPLWPTVPHPRPTAPGAPQRPTGARPASADHVVVAAGDSLWSIAAAHLDQPSPRRVAAAWPRWYAANRTVIGADPDHIVAGQVLTTPMHHDS